MHDSDKRIDLTGFNYDDAINAGLQAKHRGQERATRDFVAIQIIGALALFGVIAAWLS